MGMDPTDLQSEDLRRVPDEVERKKEFTLRPRTFEEFIGQSSLIKKLQMFTKAAQGRNEPIDHLLLCGPPGLGKTSLAHLIAKEMGGHMIETSGPALVRPGEIVSILTSLQPGDVLFIDEIHRLNRVVEETLYPAMEDWKVDIMLDPKGPAARSVRLDLSRFTLIGATTRAGLLSAPLRDRFGFMDRLEFYPPEDLMQIVRQTAQRLASPISNDAAMEIAKRSRGTPRIANRLLKRVRDFSQVRKETEISWESAQSALELLGVDQAGLDSMDRKILELFLDVFSGGPVGIDSLSASLGEDLGTLEDVYEPFLLQAGFISRTPRGRMITEKGAKHIGRTFVVKGLSNQLTLD